MLNETAPNDQVVIARRRWRLCQAAADGRATKIIIPKGGDPGPAGLARWSRRSRGEGSEE
ncbi:MAG: hypothetical protein ACLU9S_11265 [Oscillospiraceae bacterium]